MMDAAENYFREAGCQAVDLRSSARARRSLPFIATLATSKSGTALFAPDVPVKVPCHYILMSKILE